MGNRISKTVMDMTGKRNPAPTYYTRDAQGNTMAVYDNTYYKSDFVACEIDRGMFEDIYNYLLQIKEQAMQSEDPNHYQNLLEQYIRNRWQEDSCRYKYIQKLGAMSLPCNLPAEYHSFIQQLYYQDFEYINDNKIEIDRLSRLQGLYEFGVDQCSKDQTPTSQSTWRPQNKREINRDVFCPLVEDFSKILTENGIDAAEKASKQLLAFSAIPNFIR